MKSKMLDCVQMKYKGAEAVQAATSKLTRQEELEYWKKGTSFLLNLKDKKKSASRKS